MPLSMRIVRNQSGQIRKLQDKVEKLKEKLKATERAQSTEENRSGGQLVAVRRRSVIAELDAVFYQRLTFRKDAWRACRRTAKQGSFVCREGVTRPIPIQPMPARNTQQQQQGQCADCL